MVGFFFIKTSVHGGSIFAGCAFEKKHLWLHDQHLHFLWYLCGSESHKKLIYLSSDNISWHICKTPFTRGFLLPGFQWPLIQTSYQEILQKRFLVETFTYFRDLSIASTSAVKNTANISQSITHCAIRTHICRSYFHFNLTPVSLYVTIWEYYLFN